MWLVTIVTTDTLRGPLINVRPPSCPASIYPSLTVLIHLFPSSCPVTFTFPPSLFSALLSILLVLIVCTLLVWRLFFLSRSITARTPAANSKWKVGWGSGIIPYNSKGLNKIILITHKIMMVNDDNDIDMVDTALQWIFLWCSRLNVIFLEALPLRYKLIVQATGRSELCPYV